MKIENKNGSLVITDFDEVEAYIVACRIEADGINFYKKIHGQIQDKKVKESFDLLLKEEEKHLKLFTNRLYELRQVSQKDYDDDDLLSSIDYGIFHPYGKIESIENLITDNRMALSLGIAIENRSIEYYLILLKNISSQIAKKEIEKIIEEENRHKKLLENFLKTAKI